MQSALVIKQIDDYDYILREQFGFRCADERCCKTYTVPKERGWSRNYPQYFPLPERRAFDYSAQAALSAGDAV